MTVRDRVPPAARNGVAPRGSTAQAVLRRALPWAALALPALATLLLLLALAGAALDDRAIDARTGHSTAEVLAVTPARTLVQFSTPDGQVHAPEEGLAYPSGLQVGQLVRVEYDRADPEEVRVAGRSWVRGLAPAGVAAGVCWALGLPAAWWLRRRIAARAA